MNSDAQACVALGQADYRGCGTADLVLCSADGEVRGYERSKVNLCALQQERQTPQQAELCALLEQKRQLQSELAHYETNVRFNREHRGAGDETAATAGAGAASEVGCIPANTRLQIAIYTNIDDMARPRIEIKIATNNATVIRAVLIFADGIFAAETHIVYPAERGVPQVKVPFVLPRDASYDVHIKALVGHAHSHQFHVFELTRQLPRFAMYAVLEEWLPAVRMLAADAPAAFRVPQCWVRFETAERWQRIMLWINQNFLLSTDLEPDTADVMDAYRMYMVSLHDRSHVLLTYAAGRVVTLYTDSIGLAGEVVQSLARFLNVADLQTEAHFPAVEQQVQEWFRKIDGYQRTYGQLSVDLAQKKNQERALVVRLEDARLYQQ